MTYPTFTKVVMNIYSFLEDDHVIQYGKNLLDLMLQKVTHENIQNPGLYTLRKMDIAQFIIKKINIS